MHIRVALRLSVRCNLLSDAAGQLYGSQDFLCPFHCLVGYLIYCTHLRSHLGSSQGRQYTSKAMESEAKDKKQVGVGQSAKEKLSDSVMVLWLSKSQPVSQAEWDKAQDEEDYKRRVKAAWNCVEEQVKKNGQMCTRPWRDWSIQARHLPAMTSKGRGTSSSK